MLNCALCVLFLITFILYLIQNSRERHVNFPPGPPRLPLYGSYWFLLAVNYSYFHKSLIYYSKKYNTNILGFYLGNLPSIAIFDYKTCKEVLKKDEYSLRPFSIITYERCMRKLGGIFFGNNWREQRWFGLRHLRDFGFGRRSCKVEDYIQNEVKNLIELLSNTPKEYDSDVCKEKGLVYMPHVMQGYLLNIAFLMLTARKYDYKKLRYFAKIMQRFVQSVDPSGCAISITPWLRYIAPDFFGFSSAYRDNKPWLDFLKDEIKQHEATFISGYPRDFIDVYIEELIKLKANSDSNTSISEHEMLMTTFDFVFPVTIGLAQTLNFIFAYLLHYPEVQRNIQREIDEVVGSARLPTLDDRINLPYTEATIREVLRINPISPLAFRMTSETTTLCGYTIPKGTFVYPCMYSVHMDPNIWGDPENFRPERWLDDNGKLIKKDYSLAFGAGKRLCVGETFSRNIIFLVICGLLQHFTFEPENDILPDLVNLIPGLTVSISDYWMRAVER